ncbi:MAG TPA: hypothetical protein VNJ70_07245 [Thermoanaerobaculia bacterium]|nr:hypothetical protein [Thermoanaerobaculia bacterium]
MLRQLVLMTALSFSVDVPPTALAAMPSAGHDCDSVEQATKIPKSDLDGNGVVTRDEWLGGKVSFRLHDRNGDGVLTAPDEVRSRAHRADERRLVSRCIRFRHLDRDEDGLVSRAEWWRSAGEFGRLDRDRDGVLSQSEFLAVGDSLR